METARFKTNEWIIHFIIIILIIRICTLNVSLLYIERCTYCRHIQNKSIALAHIHHSPFISPIRQFKSIDIWYLIHHSNTWDSYAMKTNKYESHYIMFFNFSFVLSFEIPTRLIAYYLSIFDFFFYFSYFNYSIVSIANTLASCTHSYSYTRANTNANMFLFDFCSRSLFRTSFPRIIILIIMIVCSCSFHFAVSKYYSRF